MLKIYFVPHTHFDAEVFLTREEYLNWGFSNILDALRLLSIDPDFKFTLEQVCYIEPFMERFPESRETFLKYVKNGRLAIVCGMYSMADMNIPSGESLARQFLRGITYCREVLGVEVEIGWTLDSFGHSPQTPQIMKLAGFRYHAFARVSPFDCKDFIWEAPDGSRMLCHHMPFSYGGIGVNISQEAFDAAVLLRAEQLRKYAAADIVMIAEGADLATPHFGMPGRIRSFNATHSDAQIIIATPDEFFRELETVHDKLQVVHADLNPLFQGCYTSRIEVKQGNRQCEEKLTTAELLAAVNKNPIEDKNFSLAWDNVLFNQFHDDICGCHVDKVFKIIMDRYKFSSQIADSTAAFMLQKLADKIDTTGEGIPVIAFNPLGWERREAVSVKVSAMESGVKDFKVYDSTGKELQFSLNEMQIYQDGFIREAVILFVADLPAAGYEIFRVVPQKIYFGHKPGSDIEHSFNKLEAVNYENEFLTMQINNYTGVVEKLALKGGDELIDQTMPFGGMMVMEPDIGDFWELYAPLRGAIAVPLDRSNSYKKNIPGAVYSKDAGSGCWAGGDSIRREFHYNRFDFKSSRFYCKITLYDDLPRVEFEGYIENKEKDVRYVSAFPLDIKDGKITRGIPFGFTENPEGEYPTLDFMDYSNNDGGITFINTGNPGCSVKDGVFSIALLKAATYKTYSGGGYDENTPAFGGFEIGKNIPFRFALLPHRGVCDPAAAARAAREFNVRPRVMKCAVHEGILPAKMSFLHTESADIVISSLKPCKGGMILRLYEAGGKDNSSVKIEFGFEIKSAVETDFTERSIGSADIVVDKSSISFPIKANEIKTFCINS